jgi:hypothetical protein
MIYDFPQCGEETETLDEGYCPECCYQRQKELDEHNARYTWWNSLTDRQRNDEIKKGALLA